MSLIKNIGSALTKQFNGFNIRVREDGYIDEKNGIIATKDCKITELMKKLDDSNKLAEDRFQKLMSVVEQTDKKLTEESKKTTSA